MNSDRGHQVCQYGNCFEHGPGSIVPILSPRSWGMGWVARANSFARGVSNGYAGSNEHRQTSLAVPPNAVNSVGVAGDRSAGNQRK